MRRRKSVTVQQRTAVRGSANQTEYTDTGNPTSVSCNVYPLSAVEIQYYGDRGRDMRKLFCDSWPGDMNSLITFAGAAWDQVAPEQTFDQGSASQHIEVVIRKR